MRILILDDMPERHKIFKVYQKSTKNIVIHTYKYEDCIMELNSTPDGFDLIFLDHDLSLETIMCNPDDCLEKTGTDVVKWMIGNMDPKKSGQVICHSMNPAGRDNMHRILDESGFNSVNVPFIHLPDALKSL